jgi:hypothetical protein
MEEEYMRGVYSNGSGKKKQRLKKEIALMEKEHRETTNKRLKLDLARMISYTYKQLGEI